MAAPVAPRRGTSRSSSIPCVADDNRKASGVGKVAHRQCPCANGQSNDQRCHQRPAQPVMQKPPGEAPVTTIKQGRERAQRIFFDTARRDCDHQYVRGRCHHVGLESIDAQWRASVTETAYAMTCPAMAIAASFAALLNTPTPPFPRSDTPITTDACCLRDLINTVRISARGAHWARQAILRGRGRPGSCGACLR